MTRPPIRWRRAAWSVGLAMLCGSAGYPGAALAQTAAPPPQAEAAGSTPQPAMVAFEPTECAGENDLWGASGEADGDIRLAKDANLRVMFHGNRFVAANELIAAFEKAHPDARISYTTLPPLYTVDQILGNTPKIAALADFGRPDVVMLPHGNMLPGSSDKLLYSRIRGMVLVARADDDRVTGADAPATNPELKIVFQGKQDIHRQITYVLPRAHYGAPWFDAWIHSPRASFSQAKHHRSVPARVLLGCADVGFQFKQSQVYLEQAKPGRFKFFDVPAAAELLKPETSFLYVRSPTNVLATRFEAFMHGAEGQGILAKYSLQK